MRRIITAVSIAVLLSACGGDEDEDSGSPIVVPTPAASPTPSPSPTPTTAADEVGVGGGIVSVAGVGAVTFPAGALAQVTKVNLQRSNLPAQSGTDFGAAVGLLKATKLSDFALEILVGTKQPTGSATVRMTVPAEFVAALPTDTRLVVIAMTENASETEGPYTAWEGIPATVAGGEIQFQADPIYFAARNSQGTHHGMFAVAQVGVTQR